MHGRGKRRGRQEWTREVGRVRRQGGKEEKLYNIH